MKHKTKIFVVHLPETFAEQVADAAWRSRKSRAAFAREALAAAIAAMSNQVGAAS